MPTGPVPGEWMDRGAPAEAFAAFSDGACPVHLAMLEPGHITVLHRPWPAGWCGQCRCWWHTGPDWFVPDGLVATWHPSGDKEDSAGKLSRP